MNVDSIVRGTTPTMTFDLPFATNTLSSAWVSFSQGGDVVVNKTLADCTVGPNSLTVRLTQADTLLLRSSLNTEIQIRALTTSGDALASDIISVSTGRILKDGVLG